MSHMQNHQLLFEMAQSRQQELLAEAAQAQQVQSAYASNRRQVVVDWLRRLTHPQLSPRHSAPATTPASGWR